MGFWKGVFNRMKDHLEETKEYREIGRSMDDEKLLKAIKNSSGARKSGYKLAAEERGLILKKEV